MGQDVPYKCDAPGGRARASTSPWRTAASAQFLQTRPAPWVHIAGDTNHSDFRNVLELIQHTANVTEIGNDAPELIIIAQSCPGTFAIPEVDALRRAAPLAGMVALAGTWCEGEPRTGRPWPGVQRLYWYEFPAWWQRQVALRAAGECPDWARPASAELRIADCGSRIDSTAPRETIAIDSSVRETADAIADVLCRVGYTTIWQPSNRPHNRFRGAIAGIWDGGQLSDREGRRLSQFCHQLSADAAPVIALFDFPRRERVDQALSLGVTAVLSKPWQNADLITAVQTATARTLTRRAA